MNTFTAKKAAGSHRYLPIGLITNQPASIFNQYVPGSGVGASNKSNRRAKLIHATPKTPFCNNKSSILGLYTKGGTNIPSINSHYLNKYFF
jgi:hypothetical protein